ncbi:MAG: DMT family transporter [Betaproteobacteria bacterium]
MKSPSAGGALAGLCTLTLIWGLNWIVMKMALQHADPFVFNIQRTLLAIAALFAVIVVQRRPFWPESWVAAAVTGLIQISVNFFSTSMALVEGGAGRTSVLVFTMPFWTLLLAWPILGERMRGAQWAAVVLAGAGLTMVVAPWHWEGAIASKLWAVLSGLGWAAAIICTKWFQRDRTFDPINFTAWLMAIGLLPFFPFVAFRGAPAVTWDFPYALELFYVGVISTALGWILWLAVLRRLSANAASFNMLAIPIVALTSSMLVYGEELTRDEWFGIALIGAGLVLLGMLGVRAVRAAKRNEPPLLETG